MVLTETLNRANSRLSFAPSFFHRRIIERFMYTVRSEHVVRAPKWMICHFPNETHLFLFHHLYFCTLAKSATQNHSHIIEFKRNE